MSLQVWKKFPPVTWHMAYKVLLTLSLAYFPCPELLQPLLWTAWTQKQETMYIFSLKCYFLSIIICSYWPATLKKYLFHPLVSGTRYKVLRSQALRHNYYFTFYVSLEICSKGSTIGATNQPFALFWCHNNNLYHSGVYHSICHILSNHLFCVLFPRDI